MEATRRLLACTPACAESVCGLHTASPSALLGAPFTGCWIIFVSVRTYSKQQILPSWCYVPVESNDRSRCPGMIAPSCFFSAE